MMLKVQVCRIRDACSVFKRLGFLEVTLYTEIDYVTNMAAFWRVWFNQRQSEMFLEQKLEQIR